jgi:hypothetical protein
LPIFAEFGISNDLLKIQEFIGTFGIDFIDSSPNCIPEQPMQESEEEIS